jgi:hypothetical protein
LPRNNVKLICIVNGAGGVNGSVFARNDWRRQSVQSDRYNENGCFEKKISRMKLPVLVC